MTDNLHKGASSALFELARKNRQSPTQAEHALWEQVRNRRFRGFKFRRQHPISNFIADFYCAECSLVVEVDGDVHLNDEQMQYDKGRTFELLELGVRVIRFRNEEVLGNMAEVLITLGRYLIPGPSPLGEGSK